MVTPSTPCIHNGDSTGDSEFNFYVSYVLILIKAYLILVCTHYHIGYEYDNDLPPIHKGPLRPSDGIMAHLVVRDLLIYPFSLRKAYPQLERS